MRAPLLVDPHTYHSRIWFRKHRKELLRQRLDIAVKTAARQVGIDFEASLARRLHPAAHS